MNWTRERFVGPFADLTIRWRYAVTGLSIAVLLVSVELEEILSLADRVVLLDDGSVVASGTHDDLLATEPRYLRVWP